MLPVGDRPALTPLFLAVMSLRKGGDWTSVSFLHPGTLVASWIEMNGFLGDWSPSSDSTFSCYSLDPIDISLVLGEKSFLAMNDDELWSMGSSFARSR